MGHDQVQLQGAPLHLCQRQQLRWAVVLLRAVCLGCAKFLVMTWGCNRFIYVFFYICMYVCMYVRTYVRMYVCMYVCVCTCICGRCSCVIALE